MGGEGGVGLGSQQLGKHSRILLLVDTLTSGYCAMLFSRTSYSVRTWSFGAGKQSTSRSGDSVFLQAALLRTGNQKKAAIRQ